jgi:hypothetical protein
VAVNWAFASIALLLAELAVASGESAIAAVSVSAVVVEPSGPQLETSKNEKTKTKLRVNFFGEFI